LSRRPESLNAVLTNPTNAAPLPILLSGSCHGFLLCCRHLKVPLTSSDTWTTKSRST
jgi:hypothetical protein